METKLELLTLNGKEYLLDIEQAEKLGLLKEKDNRVKSWDEFEQKCEKLDSYYYIKDVQYRTTNPTSVPEQLTPHEAKALAAFSKLLKLRRDWIGEWEPDWTNENIRKFVICYIDKYIEINVRNISAKSLSFPTQQMAQEFLETFHDLIEEAKTLI